MEKLFANYRYHGKNINNLGDHAQILTIDYLYRVMGIEEKNIVYIDIDKLSTYDGPPVKLPVSLPLVNYYEHGVAGLFSKNITPVFFGLTMPKVNLLPEEIEYYKRYEPIGCRDEQAYLTMTKYGIKAYIGGCLTVTLPKRNLDTKKQNKIFIVDIPIGVRKFIPEEIMKEAIIDTHILYGKIDNPTELAKKQYEKYKNEAKLVITGLLHGSVPCSALGIPVVLARDYVSYRFAWLEALMHIYTPDEYGNIDWNPDSEDFEAHKILVRNLFKKRMQGEKFEDEMKAIHEFYMNRKRKEYVNDVFFSIQQFIDDTWKDHNGAYKFSIWGLTQMAEMTVNYIQENYPYATLMHVYDKNTELTFHGISAILPDEIVKYPDETVFVTTVSAAESAKKFFSSIEKPEYLYKTLEIIR